MSPRAACRLHTLGFDRVYDYVPGKVDWLARGLPVEGSKAGEPRVFDRMRTDVATCALDTPISEVRERLEASGQGFALVVTSDGIILGRVPRSELGDDDAATAEAVMSPGPSTVRPDTEIAELRRKLDGRGLKTAVVSTPEGRLMGIVHRMDLEAAID
jgi:CBS domain-containing protein